MGDLNQNTKNAEEVVIGCNRIPYTCNIKQLRIALGWTQSELAREVGFTSNAINMMEHEKYYPPLETRLKVAKALGTDTSAVWIPVDNSTEKTKKEPEPNQNSGLNNYPPSKPTSSQSTSVGSLEGEKNEKENN